MIPVQSAESSGLAPAGIKNQTVFLFCEFPSPVGTLSWYELGNDAALRSQRSSLALGRETYAALLEIKNTDCETHLWWAR